MTTRSRVPHLLAAAAAAVLLTLTAGCGGSSSPSGSPGPSHPTTSSSSPSSAGADVQTIRLSKHGFGFELPSGWSKIDRDGALNADSPQMKEMASHLGMDASRLVQVLETTVEFIGVTDQGADHGFLENVNVVPLGAGQASESQLRLQILSIAGKEVHTEKVDTPLGPGVTISYTLSSAGNVVNGKALAIGTSTDDQVLITVSAHDASTAAARLEQIRASLARTS